MLYDFYDVKFDLFTDDFLDSEYTKYEDFCDSGSYLTSHSLTYPNVNDYLRADRPFKVKRTYYTIQAWLSIYN